MWRVRLIGVSRVVALAACAFAVVSCLSSTEPKNGSPFRNILTVTPTYVRVGDSVKAVWTMTNTGDKPYDLAFAPFGQGVEDLLGISVTQQDSVLETVDVEYFVMQYSGIFFYAHNHMTLHAAFLAAKIGTAKVQACLPPKLNVDDPWECQTEMVTVHR